MGQSVSSAAWNAAADSAGEGGEPALRIAAMSSRSLKRRRSPTWRSPKKTGSTTPLDRAFDREAARVVEAALRRIVPGGGKGGGIRSLAERIGGLGAHPDRLGPRRDDPAPRELLEKSALPVGRPPVAMGSGGNGGKAGESVIGELISGVSGCRAALFGYAEELSRDVTASILFSGIRSSCKSRLPGRVMTFSPVRARSGDSSKRIVTYLTRKTCAR